MIYTFDSRIRFSEVDEFGYLRFENFVNYFQDCSTFQSEDLGIGVKYLLEQKRAWVLTSWQIEVIKYPTYGDRVTIGTFAYDFKSFLGYRNFFMKDENGDYIAKASSIWVLLNTEDGKPSKPNEGQLSLYGKEEKLDMDYQSRKIIVPDSLIAKGKIEVMDYHLDTNHHVNNSQFVRIAIAAASESVTNTLRPSKVRVEYKKQAYLGDMIYSFTDGKVVDLRNEDGESYCVVELG